MSSGGQPVLSLLPGLLWAFIDHSGLGEELFQ